MSLPNPIKTNTGNDLVLHYIGGSQSKDNWSCGLHCLAELESELRLWRGEGRWLVSRDPWADKLKKLNKFFQTIQGFKAKSLAKHAAATAAVPPLPPPAEPHPCDVASAPSVPPPSAPHVDDTSEYGCTRCRYTRTGCDRCNPHKVAAKATGVPYPVSRRRGAGGPA